MERIPSGMSGGVMALGLVPRTELSAGSLPSERDDNKE